MPIYVFYASAKPQLHSTSIPLPNGKIGYIRVEQFDSLDMPTLDNALDRAEPYDGETVLNSIELTPIYNQERKR